MDYNYFIGTLLAVPPGVARAKVTSGENRDFLHYINNS
jgi:hypothetical protein